MPTYQYRCKDCECEFEATQRITARPLSKCTECGGKASRVIQSVGIIFKGSGFHVNDYPNSRGQKRSDIPPAEKTDSSSTKSDSSSDTSADKTEKTDKTDKKTDKSKKDTKAA